MCDKNNVETQFAEIAKDGLSQCVDDCEQRFFEDAWVKDKQYRQCAKQDDTKYFVLENVPISEEEVEYVHYYGNQCPEHHEFIKSDDSKECVATCGDNYEDTNEDGAKICSTGCRSGAFEDVESVHKCVEPCEGKFVQVSDTLKQCVDSCPADHKYLNDNECTAKCDSLFYK